MPTILTTTAKSISAQADRGAQAVHDARVANDAQQRTPLKITIANQGISVPPVIMLVCCRRLPGRGILRTECLLQTHWSNPLSDSGAIITCALSCGSGRH